jgi:hypothetical protein
MTVTIAFYILVFELFVYVPSLGIYRTLNFVVYITSLAGIVYFYI